MLTPTMNNQNVRPDGPSMDDVTEQAESPKNSERTIFGLKEVPDSAQEVPPLLEENRIRRLLGGGK
jgi:hypothetical protein